jgi:hypothetical protein
VLRPIAWACQYRRITRKSGAASLGIFRTVLRTVSRITLIEVISSRHGHDRSSCRSRLPLLDVNQRSWLGGRLIERYCPSKPCPFSCDGIVLSLSLAYSAAVSRFLAQQATTSHFAYAERPKASSLLSYSLSVLYSIDLVGQRMLFDQITKRYSMTIPQVTWKASTAGGGFCGRAFGGRTYPAPRILHPA